MHEAFRVDDPRTERLRDGLVSEADAEERQLARERLDGGERDAGGVGVAGTGREDERLGLERPDAVHVDFVVAHHVHLRAQSPEVLDEVVGERVVVVDHEYHSVSANLAASNTALDLLTVSLYSFTGSESATIPAPARIVRRVPSRIIVRMTMAKSMSPVKLK